MPAKWNFNSIENFQKISLSESFLFTTSRTHGPTLLLIHGGFHGAWCWAQFLKFFEFHGVRAAALDIRGHGSILPGPNFLKEGVYEAALDVQESARALGGPIILVGHSLGALIAMVAAKTLSTAGFIMMAPSPPGQMPGLRKLPKLPDNRLVMPPDEKRARSWFLSGCARSDISEFMSRLCPESPTMINDRYRLRIKVNSEWVQSPSLCLSAGNDDKVHHPEGQDRQVADFFNANYKVLSNSGHCFMLDDTWEQAALEILDWLKQKHLVSD